MTAPPPGRRSGWTRGVLTGRSGALVLLLVLVLAGLGLRQLSRGGTPAAVGPDDRPSPSPGATATPGTGPTEGPTEGPTTGPTAGPTAGTSAAPSAPVTPPASSSPPAPPSPTPSPQVTCVPQTTRATLRVVTYNIKSARYQGRPRVAQIVAELKDVRPDVVLLQEVDKNRPISGRMDEPALLGTGLGYQYSFGLNVLRPGDSQYGTAILSRHAILASNNVHLPNAAGEQQRGLLGVSIKVKGISVNVYDTHLTNVRPSTRMAQIKAVTKVLAQDPTPKILGGDLNAVPASPVLQDAYRTLSDTWSAVGVGAGHTVPASTPRARIDYLLYQQGRDTTTTITPLSAQVLGVGSSDHRAVLATYRLDATADPVCQPVP